MPRRPLTRQWTTEDIAKLISLVESGASLARASAALGRNGNSVQKKARQLGLRFPGARAVRASLREAGAIEPSRRRPSKVDSPT
jgi:hypothetical protein